MPTYRYSCDHCGGGFEQWLSIHADRSEHPRIHPDCGGTVKLAIVRVATYGVGDRGEGTRTADARERQLDLDRPAYKRLRSEGHQPRSLMGSHALEAKATDDWFIKTGGLVSVPDEKTAEVNERLADARFSGWNPVEQVHHERSA